MNMDSFLNLIETFGAGLYNIADERTFRATVKPELDRMRAALAAQPRQHSPAITAFAAERQRQIAKGFDASHDDMATYGKLAGAAACYSLYDTHHWAKDQIIKTVWPWADEWWKPADAKRNIEKAGALLAAEWERLDRIDSTRSSNGDSNDG